MALVAMMSSDTTLISPANFNLKNYRGPARSHWHASLELDQKRCHR
jgi:hypothetical protein